MIKQGLSLVLAAVFFCISLVQADETKNEALAPDVRVIIDISGSMKLNDPDNLRQPALELLVRLFPEQAKAGVWTFGQWVNMLVKHGAVDEAWRNEALVAAKKINSVALYTNIPDALSKAVDDLDRLDPGYATHLILLTDGMVDISKSADENARARETVLKEILPALRKAGVTVHTVALSKNADSELMERLAVDTGGLTAVAHSAEDLTRIFLQAFDAAAPAEQLPLSGNGFVVDSSVEEFTALIFRKEGSAETVLVSPDQQQYRAGSTGQDIRWHREGNYDLITVSSPFEGEWQVLADLEPSSRVTVVSNLNLAVNRLVASMFVGADEEMSALIEEQGKTVQNADFLQLVEMQLSVTRRDDGQQWQRVMAGGDVPANGLYIEPLEMLAEAGVYDIVVTAQGKTFARERKQTVAVRELLKVTQSSTDDTIPQHTVTLFANNPDIDTQASTVLARVQRPDGSSALKAVKVIEDRTWQVTFKGVEQSGTYEVTFEATGQYLSGGRFDFSTEPELIEHRVAGSPAPAPAVEPEASVEPEAIEPESAEPDVAEQPAEPEPEVDEPQGVTTGDMLLYGSIALGNLLAIGLGFIAYRMVTGTGKSDVLEQDDDVDLDAPTDNSAPDKKAAVAEPEPEPEPEPAVEPDLEPVDELDAMDEALDLGEVDDELDGDLLDVSDTDELADVSADDDGLAELSDDDEDFLDLPDDAIDIDPEKDEK